MNHQKLDAIKYACTHQKTPTKCSLTQKQRAEKMNVLFKTQGIQLCFKQKQMSELENDGRSLSLVDALALSQVLGIFMLQWMRGDSGFGGFRGATAAF